MRALDHSLKSRVRLQTWSEAGLLGADGEGPFGGLLPGERARLEELRYFALQALFFTVECKTLSSVQ